MLQTQLLQVRYGHVTFPNLQSQAVTCYLHDPNPGSSFSLQDFELPHAIITLINIDAKILKKIW